MCAAARCVRVCFVLSFLFGGGGPHAKVQRVGRCPLSGTPGSRGGRRTSFGRRIPGAVAQEKLCAARFAADRPQKDTSLEAQSIRPSTIAAFA